MMMFRHLFNDYGEYAGYAIDYAPLTGDQVTLVALLFDFLGLSKAFGTPTLNPTWWYLSLAMLLIFATPFVMSAVRKFGSLPVLVVGVLGIAMFEVGTDAVFMYAASYLMGIFCHENGVLDGWKGWLSDRRGGHALKALLALGPSSSF